MSYESVAKNRSPAARILILGAVPAILPSGVMFWMLVEMRSNGRLKGDGTQHSVESAWSVLNWYDQQASSGKMPATEAQRAAKQIIGQLRFENGNYIWINDLDARIILHRAIPDYEGKEMSGFRDPNGVTLLVEAARLAQPKGERPIRYMWPRPGEWSRRRGFPKSSCFLSRVGWWDRAFM
jgi:methyl-accepting chemotaxis protein